MVVHPQGADFEAALASGERDLVVLPRRGRAPGLIWTPLARDGYVCLVRRDHPRVGKTLSLRRFCELPHVLVSPALQTRGAVDAALARAGASRRIAVRVPSFLAAPLLVAQSELVAVVPRRVGEHAVRRHQLRMLPLPLEVPALEVAMAWHERSRHDPGHVWLRRVMVASQQAEP